MKHIDPWWISLIKGAIIINLLLLVFALLVTPAATAQLITPRIGPSLVLTVLLGIAITWVGLALSYFYIYPVGFYITTVAFAVYVTGRLARAVIDHPSLLRHRGAACSPAPSCSR